MASGLAAASTAVSAFGITAALAVLLGAAVTGIDRTGPGGVALPPVATGPGIHVVDGDTVDHDGRRWRLTGYDTPEIYHARCAAERQRGIIAAARLAELMRDGATVEKTSERREKWGRGLGRVVLTDGRDAGAVLISEGHARHYDGRSRREGWCE